MTNGTKIPTKCKSLFYKNRPNQLGGNSNFSIISENGGILNCFHEPCFARLERINYDEAGMDKPKYIAYYGYKPSSLERKHYKEFSIAKYYDWLINRSPFHFAFPNQYLRRTVDTCIVVDASTPSNLMVAALIAARYPYEHPQVIKLMQKLVEKGVDENLAFLTGHAINSWDKQGRVRFKNSLGTGGHQVLWGANIHNLKAYISNDFNSYVLRDPHSVDKIYTGVDGIFSAALVDMQGESEKIRQGILDIVQHSVKKKKGVKKDPFHVLRNELHLDNDSIKIIAAELSNIYVRIMGEAA